MEEITDENIDAAKTHKDHRAAARICNIIRREWEARDLCKEDEAERREVVSQLHSGLTSHVDESGFSIGAYYVGATAPGRNANWCIIS